MKKEVPCHHSSQALVASAGEAGAQGRIGGMGKVLATWAPYGSPMEEEISPPLPYYGCVD